MGYSLNDCLSFSNGKKYPNSKGNIPIYGGNGVLGYCEESNASNCIIIGRVGVYCGSVYYEKGKSWVSDNAIMGFAKEGFDIRFLYYLLLTLNLQKRQQGTSQPLLTQGLLKSISIPRLPEISTQRRISSFLSLFDQKIELNNLINDYLAELVSLMFERLIEKCVETVPLSTYATISSGKRPPTKSPVFTDECVFPLFGASSQMGYTSEYLTDEKLLVIGRVGTHGVVQRVSGKAWPSDNTLVIRSDHYETASQLLQRVDYPSLNRGSTQPLITQGDLKNYEVPRISPVALERFEDQAGQLMSLYDHNCIESAKLIELRDALLPRLMSGELDASGVTI